MAIIIKTKKEIKLLRESGRRLSIVLDKIIDKVKTGVTTQELNMLAIEIIRNMGDSPAFLGYKPYGADVPYPAALCVSVNDEIVHGIPKDIKLKNGDIVGLDIGINHKGMITDMAKTVRVGEIDNSASNLMEATESALDAGILAAKGGNKIGDISNAIQQVAKKNNVSIVEGLGGHGVGRSVHEDPFISNFGKKNTGATLKPGMVLALEPIFNEGEKEIFLSKDGYTFKTADRKRSAHYEHTILITKGDAEILTIR